MFDLGFKFEKNVIVCFSNVYVQNKMAINEENLSISVQKYTVLFDTGHKEFDVNNFENTWKIEVEKEKTKLYDKLDAVIWKNWISMHS